MALKTKSSTKSILFIVEKGIIEGKYYFGSSGDLFFIAQALRSGFIVYLTTPKQIIEQGKVSDFLAIKLSTNLNQNQIDEQIKSAWHNQVINAFVALEMNANDNEEAKSKILFNDTKIEKINVCQISIFNRAEPTSLSNKFYDILINWQKNGAKILPNPYLNKTLGDKLAIDAIHYNKSIAGIDLLANIDLKNQKHQISFESKIINISCNVLTNEEIIKFYNLLATKDLAKAKKLFEEEYNIFMRGVKEYIEFHKELDSSSVIKPLNYFSGIGIVTIKNKKLNLELAIQNVVNSFSAIKQDCQKKKDLAFLPTIIVQKIATEAHLGDLRIVFCGDNLQGIFVRVNRNFVLSSINNLCFGGHPQSLFKHYSINKSGIDKMIIDMRDGGSDIKNINKVQALYGLIDSINLLKKIKIFKQYPIIGVDALLTKDGDSNYRYGINEINLTSPMGQVQLIILEIATKLSNLALQTLSKNNFYYQINLAKYQVLADYFIDQKIETALLAKKILLQDEQLNNLIVTKIDQFLRGDNFANQTIQHFIS
jgi:hypothetical protein